METTALGQEFNKLLRENISTKDFISMKMKNIRYPKETCASHEYVDANQLFQQAWNNIGEGSFVIHHILQSEKERISFMKCWDEGTERSGGNKDVLCWSFVEKYFPNYSSSQKIYESDCLHKTLNKEDDESTEMVLKEYDGKLSNIENDYNSLMIEIYEEAIINFMKKP
jgi:hypothetical protein